MNNLSEFQKGFVDALIKYDVPRYRIEELLNSGYIYYCENGKPRLLDRYYDISASLDMDTIKRDVCPQKELQTFKVCSLKDAQAIINRQLLSLSRDLKNRIVFRGENTAYYLASRAFPNPHIRVRNGREPSLIPSYWRQFASNNYTVAEDPPDLLKSLYAYPLIYEGIDIDQAFKSFIEENKIISMSDLEEISNVAAKTIYDRYTKNMIFGKDSLLLAQHYGLKTANLDVTYDLKVALFFALYKFERNFHGKATYVRNPNSNSVVYCLLLPDSESSKRGMITQIDMYDHIPALRPIVQKCALIHHNFLEINKSAAHILFALDMSPDFDFSEIPLPAELFPPPSKDEFYKHILKLKKDISGGWDDIVEYDFG